MLLLSSDFKNTKSITYLTDKDAGQHFHLYVATKATHPWLVNAAGVNNDVKGVLKAVTPSCPNHTHDEKVKMMKKCETLDNICMICPVIINGDLDQQHPKVFFCDFVTDKVNQWS